jgi:hypothetical protein
MKIETYGKSNGTLMTFDQHLANYSDKEELATWKRIHELLKANKQQSLNKEFGSFGEAAARLEEITKKIFKDWVPL